MEVEIRLWSTGQEGALEGDGSEGDSARDDVCGVECCRKLRDSLPLCLHPWPRGTGIKKVSVGEFTQRSLES